MAYVRFLAVSLFACSCLVAQETVAIRRLTGEIKLDGWSTESAWESVPLLDLTMSSPTYGGAPTERTEIRLGYSDDALYVSGRFFDSDIGNLRASTLVRDGIGPQDDLFALILDTFNDNENALGFLTSPAGIRADFAVFNDAESSGPPPFNTSWNTFWDVAAAQDEHGWYAEMRIPFSSLRFQSVEDEIVMGMIVWRYYPRKNETVTYPKIPPTSAWGIMKPSYAQKISLNGIHSPNPAYLTPYVLVGGSFAHDLNEEETAYIRSENRPREIGIDFKYGLSSNLTLDLTLNTDFAQVEADDQQVNLTRFSLFFPEKRLFFQERSSIFDFSTGGPNRTFYSRQIGISEEGPVRILGGVRLVGRVGEWDLGILNMQTDNSEDLPSENFGVLRLRRQVINENSYAGGIVTTRYGNNGRYNLVYGLDGIVRVAGDHYLIANWVQSFDDTLLTAKKTDAFNSVRARLQMERRNVIGFGYDLGVSVTTEYFNPAIGFAPRTNYMRIGDRVSYGWYPKNHPWLLNHTLALMASTFIRNTDGLVESVELGPSWNFNTKAGGWGSVGLSANYENIPEEFELSDDAVVPVGKYRFAGAKGSYQSPFGSLLRTAISFEAGTFYDGWKTTIGINPAWTVSKHFELSGDYQAIIVRFPERKQAFNAHIGRVRMRFTLNTELSLSTFTQYNSATGSVGMNLRLRYNPREGNDLYLVYDEGLNTDPLRFTPKKQRNESRAIVLKYSYTFVL